MKRLLIFFLSLASITAGAQEVDRYGNTENQRTIFPGRVSIGKTFALPSDTFPIPYRLADLPWFAAKGDVTYIWSRTQFKWVPAGGGGGGSTYTFSSDFSVDGSNISIAGYNPARWDSTYAWWKSNPLAGYQLALPLGTVNQYIRGNHTLGNFNEAVTAITDPLYSKLGHTHTSLAITDFTAAVRALFSGSAYITISPTGQISYTGPTGGEGGGFMKFDPTLFTVVGDSVYITAIPATMITGSKTAAFISDFVAQVQATGDARYIPLTQRDSLRMAFYRMSQPNDSTTRFHRINGTYQDQQLIGSVLPSTAISNAGYGLIKTNATTLALDTANALWHLSAGSADNHIYTKAHRLGVGTTAPVAGLDMRGVFDLTFPAVQIKDSTSPGGYMWLSDGSNVDGRFSATLIGKNAGDTTVPNRNGLSLVGIPGMDSSIHSAVSIDGRMEYSPFSYSTLTKAKLLRIANNQVEKLYVTIDGGIWSNDLNDGTGVDKQILVNNGRLKVGAVPGSGGSGGSVNLKRQQWKNSTATTYTLTSTASGSFAAVFYNGVELDSDDYTVSGTTLTLLFTPTTSDRISIHYSY